MNLMQERAATHGDLGTQESIIKKCRHGPAQQKVLFDLILRRPRRHGLMGQNILAGDGRHNFNSPELLRTCQRSTTGMFFRSSFNGDRGTVVNLSGSQS